jgi:sirohydrochlorin cobaltochelatase
MANVLKSDRWNRENPVPGTCLILYAHGSRDPNWRRPFEQLAGELQRDVGEERVQLAYMEFAKPTLLDVAGDLQRRGIGRIRLLPLFLAGGAHVANDIPQQVGELMDRYPGLEVEVLSPIGEDPRLVSLMRAIATEFARPDRGSPVPGRPCC